jgi:hypothetical protein
LRKNHFNKKTGPHTDMHDRFKTDKFICSIFRDKPKQVYGNALIRFLFHLK